MNENSFVSIVIPCRNEERFIGKCLDSIIDQDYPKDKLEVLVVDGMSEDKTREVLREFSRNHSFVKILENDRKITPAGMNVGLKKARGDIVIMVNAHCVLDKKFIKHNVDYFKKTGEADAVGGKLQTINEGQGIVALAIPLAADSVFGAGGKRYRTRDKEGFIKDTVPYCAYKKEVFSKIGYIDEDLIRDQDEEFNYRLIKQGGKIYFIPEIKSYLFIRPSLSKLWRQHFQYGYFKPLVARKAGGVLTWRQVIPSLFVGSLLAAGILSLLNRYFLLLFLFIISLYIIINFSFSLIISIKNRNLLLLPFLVASFAALHFSYGSGYLKGILDFIILGKHLKNKIKDVPLTR